MPSASSKRWRLRRQIAALLVAFLVAKRRLDSRNSASAGAHALCRNSTTPFSKWTRASSFLASSAGGAGGVASPVEAGGGVTG
jgi:hypothetical protein